ncbi:MAG: baseplate J/gp47 family protein [Anaerovoracaceae bacterium]
MIDDRVLDQVIPVPDFEEKKEEILEALAEEGFEITNARSGGVFLTLLSIVLKCHIELKQLARSILQNMFVDSAQNEWMELKAADFSKNRKLASKTEGLLTLKRDEAGESVRIAKGTVFKTLQDANGEELRFLSTEQAAMGEEDLIVMVPIVAEESGSKYNVSKNRITKCLINLEGIDYIFNDSGWITKEGTDIEDIENLRSRTKSSWAELATLPIKEKYKNVCESVEGVFLAEIDDQHPRGQGTVDVYVTSSAGVASESLLSDVKEAVETIRGPYDNVLVKSTETVEQDVVVEIDISSEDSLIGVEETAKNVVIELLSIRPGKKLNSLTHTDLIYNLKKQISIAEAIRVTTPVEDVKLEKGKILIAGNITIILAKV